MARSPRRGQGSGFKKLEHKKEEMHDMYGNMTCMLRESNVLDSENKFNPQGIKMEFDEMKIKDAWLKAQLGKYCDQCIELAEAVPQSMLDDCAWGGEMVKTKFFMKCMMTWKIKTCMRYDIKQKLEENFGQVDNLVDKTKTRFQKNHIIKQNHNGDGFWLWGISPLTKLTHFKKILERKKTKKP